MRRRILSLMLAFVMILAMIPTAFAGDKGIGGLLEVLPGNKEISGAFVELLKNSLLGGGEEADIQQIKDLINKEYNKPHGTAGYVADANSYYVSLGDSTVTGMNTGDPAYGNYGYKTKVPTSAPYQVAQALGLDVNTQYEQLAMAGLRVTDLRYVLDATFAPDQYTLTRTKDRVDPHAGGFDQMRSDYMAALPKADLITVCIGNCNFTDFMSAQIFGAIAELLNKELYDVLNKGLFKDKIREAVSQYIDLNSKTYEMNWEGYLGAEGTAKLKAALEETKATLLAEGVPATYTLNLAEMAGESMGMSSIPATIKNKLIVNVPVVELMVYFMECFLYGYVTFVVDFEAAFDKIHEIAPDAELLVLGMYNPTDTLVFTFNGKTIPYGEYYGYMAKAMSLYLLDYAENTPNTTFVDVYGTESFTDVKLSTGESTYDLMAYVMDFAANSADFHATPAGHTNMKNQILAALAAQPEGLLGDADGSGVVDYVDAMLVLQYHTGVITNDALALAQCDVDKSGAVDYVDAMRILQYHTGVISGF